MSICLFSFSGFVDSYSEIRLYLSSSITWSNEISAIQNKGTIYTIDLTSAGYSFHHEARIHMKGEGVGILLHDSLNCETDLGFQAKSFGNYQLTFISGRISVRLAIIYRLHPLRKMGWKQQISSKNFRDLLTLLLPTVVICWS